METILLEKWLLTSLLFYGVVCLTEGQQGSKYSDIMHKIDLSYFNKTELNLLDKGYQLYPGMGYYKLYRRPVKWGEAWKQCDDDGTHLLIINSEEEVSLVLREVTSAYPPNVYIIGFHDYFSEGVYLTVYGEHLENTGYVKWGSNQPDNWRGSEHCGAMRRDGTLADVHCNANLGFICEKEL